MGQVLGQLVGVRVEQDHGADGQAPDQFEADLAATPEQREDVGHRLPRTAASRAVRGGALLPTAAGPRGRQTFDDWLRSAVRG